MEPPHNSQRILITGGRGSLASIVSRHFGACGVVVRTFSRTGGTAHLGLDELFSTAQFEQSGTLLHLAWSTVPYIAEQKTDGGMQQDLELLTKILQRLVSTPAHKRMHFIFFSSGGTVYGNASGGRPSRESDLCVPIGRYGQAKLAAEQMIEKECTKHGLTWTILRISNPYGFTMPVLRPQGIIPAAIKCARTGMPLNIWGDGSAKKDFLHYSDFLSVIEKIIQRKILGIFNVCSGQSHTIHEVLGIIEQATGQSIATEYSPAHTWDVKESLLDNAKLCAAIDWRPTTTLAEGIKRAAVELNP